MPSAMTNNEFWMPYTIITCAVSCEELIETAKTFCVDRWTLRIRPWMDHRTRLLFAYYPTR